MLGPRGCLVSAALCVCACRGASVAADAGRLADAGQTADGSQTASGSESATSVASAHPEAGAPEPTVDVAAWATWPMPNATPGLPNKQSFDTKLAGVVADRLTGLMWQQNLDGKVVTFSDAKRECTELTLAGYDDWRLPSRIELVSLLDVTRTQPSIDVTAFPRTPNDWFWTASVAADNPAAAWYVYFYFGYPKTDLQSNQFSVRCVRTGSPRPPLTSRYDAQADTVHDLGTGLTWQRTVADRTFGFDAARAYCGALGLAGKPWRVPSLTELLTLIDERAATPPMIDAVAFPSTPAEAFWTSSYFGGTAGMAWQVYFDHGNGLYGLPNAAFRVRCVTASP